MHLVSCASPPEPLEAAPRSGLLADLTDGERWDGFWSSQSDAYFVRCTRTDGATEWFSLADDASSATTDTTARVLALRTKNAPRSRVAVVVAQSPNGQRMLVGSARRTTR